MAPGATLAVPVAPDFKVRLPPVVSTAVPVTETVPSFPADAPSVISSVVPKVAVALFTRERFFKTRLPEVKLTVPAVPPKARLEVLDPLILPLPLTAPLMVSVLPLISSIEVAVPVTRLPDSAELSMVRSELS